MKLVQGTAGVDRDLHWHAMSGTVPIGVVQQQPGGAGRGRWQWFISRIYEPGWHWNGSGDTRDEAMQALGARFREWLAHAGLAETDDAAPRDGPPFTFEPSEEKFWPVMTPAGFKIGHVSKAWTEAAPITLERRLFWSGYINKFHDDFPDRNSSGATPEEVVPKIAVAFRQYLARAGLREA